MTALVTGGAGFIGSNLVDALLARGDEVVVVDDLSTGRRENLDGALAQGADAARGRHPRRRARCARSSQRERPEVVFHLAAQIDVRRSVADPAADARVNVEGTINVLEAAAHAPARGASSSPRPAARSTARPSRCRRPRTHPARRSRPTARRSSAPRATARSSPRLHGLSTVALRYANVYGPRQDPLGEGGVIAIFCGGSPTAARRRSTATARRRATTSTSATSSRRTCAPADRDVDGADQHRHRRRDVGARPRRGPAERARTASSPSTRPRAPGEVLRSALDASRAREVLGWEPKVGLEEGLQRTLDSLR